MTEQILVHVLFKALKGVESRFFQQAMQDQKLQGPACQPISLTS